MDIQNYRERIIDRKINQYLKVFGALFVEGPKWCGKTWTSRKHANSELLLADPQNNFNNKQLAQLDPDFVLNGSVPRLVDEWQEVPALWDAIRGRVDLATDKGLFILTGSASINKKSYIHSGTGRIVRLKMRTMSLYESGKSDGLVSLRDICNGVASNCRTKEVSLEELIDDLLVGGWPSTLSMNPENGALVAREYVKSVLSEDVYKVDGVKRDRRKMELLFRSLARNEATTATNTTLKKDVKDRDFDDINIDTISDYLNLFRDLYLIEDIPPFSLGCRSSLRLKQSEKRHFVDPSIPCALLSLTKEKLLNDLETLGFMFESMVERDLLTYVDSFNGKLYHYQDYRNQEMDAVIELEDGSWCGFEIKLGANKIEEAAQNLLKINETIVKEGGRPAKSLCVICGLSNAAYKRADGIFVVPITSLKD